MTLESQPIININNHSNGNGKNRKYELHFGIIPQVIIHPKQAYQWIIKQGKKRTWITPVLFILVFILLASLLSALSAKKQANTTASIALTSIATPTPQASVRTSSSTNNSSSGGNREFQNGGGFPAGGPPPGDFGGFPGGGGFPGAPGSNTSTSNTSTTSPTVTTNPILSMLASLSGFLIVWALLGVMINLFSLAFGGLSSTVMALNIAAWASLPQAIRSLLQIVYYILGGKAIQKTGLSGFISSSGNGSVFFQHLLSHIDLYFFWEVGLLAVGIGLWGGLSRKKSLAITFLSVGIILILQSLLGMGINLLSNININLGSARLLMR